MTEYRLNQTGQEVQEALDQVPVTQEQLQQEVSDRSAAVGAEKERAEGAESALDGRVANLEENAYQKPNDGIPSADLDEGVQASLNKADSALQSQEQADWNESDSTKADFIKNKPSIPDVSGKADKDEMTVTPGTGADADKTTIQLKQETSATVLVAHQDISGKADKATTLEGYGITDGYTKTEGQELESEVDDRLDAQDAAIALLNGSDVVVVADHTDATEVPNPDPQKIYREPEAVVDPDVPSYYIDWMYQNGAWKKIAKYDFPGIDDKPTHNSENLVKSGGVREALDELGYYVESEEYVHAIEDKDGKFIAGIKTDGSVEWEKGVPAPIQEALDEKVDKTEGMSLINATFAEGVSQVEDEDWVQKVVDKNDVFLYGVKKDGTFVADKMEISNENFEVKEDSEDRVEMTLDSENKVVSYRGKDGVLHEHKMNISDSLSLGIDAMNAFQKALKDSGFSGGTGDWSDYISDDGDKPLHLPIPKCALVNISNDAGNAVWPASKTINYEYYMQYWDMEGNYFKKNIIFNAQGKSSMGMPKRNGAADFFDAEHDGNVFSIKFGDWVPQDSFHLKAYYADYFVGVNPISYKLFEQMLATRNIFENRDWKKILLPSKETIGYDCHALDGEDDKYALDNGAKCFPDGFPCIVFLNGDFYGVYAWQLKKHRDNYMMSKKKPAHIHIDGCLGEDTVWMANGELDWDVLSGVTADSEGNQDGIEFRNPKPKASKDGWALTCVDGTTYDGDDNRQELIGEDNTSVYDSTNDSHVKTNKVKKAFIELSKVVPTLRTMVANNATNTEIREYIATKFDVQAFMDYLIISDINCNFDGFRKNWQWVTWDGVKWFVEPYDMDGVFGWSGWGHLNPNAPRYGMPVSGGYEVQSQQPGYWIITYYGTELDARYAELRQKGILTRDNILKLFTDWINAIGTDNYQLNHDAWPIDREHYSAAPEQRHYDNIYRVSNWLDARITKCDEIYHYNS